MAGVREELRDECCGLPVPKAHDGRRSLYCVRMLTAADTGACHPQHAAVASPHWTVDHETHLEALLGVLYQREAEVAGHLRVLLACPDTNQGEAYGPLENAAVRRWQEVVRAFDPQALSEDGPMMQWMAVGAGLQSLSEDGHSE